MRKLFFIVNKIVLNVLETLEKCRSKTFQEIFKKYGRQLLKNFNGYGLLKQTISLEIF